MTFVSLTVYAVNRNPRNGQHMLFETTHAACRKALKKNKKVAKCQMWK